MTTNKVTAQQHLSLRNNFFLVFFFDINLFTNQMLSFFWTDFSSFALASLIAQANFGVPPAAGEQLPETARFQSVETANTYFDEPLCYIQTSDSRVIDLTHLCGRPPTLPPFSYPRPPQVYDNRAIRTFDDSVYGEGN